MLEAFCHHEPSTDPLCSEECSRVLWVVDEVIGHTEYLAKLSGSSRQVITSRAASGVMVTVKQAAGPGRPSSEGKMHSSQFSLTQVKVTCSAPSRGRCLSDGRRS